MGDARRYRVAAEFGCSSPVWDDDWDGEREINPSPEDIGLSLVLSEAIRSWAEHYNTLLNQEYPPDSGFDSADESAQFNERGEALVRQMQQELGSRAAVRYVPVRR